MALILIITLLRITNQLQVVADEEIQIISLEDIVPDYKRNILYTIEDQPQYAKIYQNRKLLEIQSIALEGIAQVKAVVCQQTGFFRNIYYLVFNNYLYESKSSQGAEMAKFQQIAQFDGVTDCYDIEFIYNHDQYQILIDCSLKNENKELENKFIIYSNGEYTTYDSLNVISYTQVTKRKIFYDQFYNRIIEFTQDNIQIEQIYAFKFDLQLQLKKIDVEINKRTSSFINQNQISFDSYRIFSSSNGNHQNGQHSNGQHSNGQQQIQSNGQQNGYNPNGQNSNIISEQKQQSSNKPFLEALNSNVRGNGNSHQKEQQVQFQPTTVLTPQLQPDPINDKLVCEQCHKAYSANNDFDKIWYLQSCFHMVCKTCVAFLVEKFYVQKEGKIMCPEVGCGHRISQPDFEQVLGKDQLAKYDKLLIYKLNNIAECIKCKLTFAIESGKQNEQVKDANGKLLTGDELKSYVQNRFKCACGQEQCRQCQASPFHIGYTCESFAKNKLAKKCRLCDTPCQPDDTKPKAIQLICSQEDCQKRSISLCTDLLKCGHFCNGVKGDPCFCLNKNCSKQDEDDYCNLCFTEALKSAPCVKLDCSHIFHEECILKRLGSKWNGPRIIFNYCECPLCKAWIGTKNVKITQQLDIQAKLKVDVLELCMERFKIEKLDKAKELKDPKHQFYNKPQEYAMNVFCFYECFKCKKPYFGGMKNCQQAAEQNNRQFNKEDLICPECCPITFENKCPKHGTKYIEFKCCFCCSMAVWFCGGTTHYCDPCHSGLGGGVKQCPGPGKCPLGVDHPPNGKEFALGCFLCRTKRVDNIIKQ